jgi:hypothetical protein
MSTRGGLGRYVGRMVRTTEHIPSDKRGHTIPAGTLLVVRKVVGEQHLDLDWPDGTLAATQVHYGKLATA